MFALLVVAPLLLAVLAIALMQQGSRYIKYAALAASLITLGLVYVVSANTSKSDSLTWFALGSSAFQISTSTNPLNMLLLWLVAMVTPLIITYSIGFMQLPSEHRRFYAEILAFASAMMVFAVAGDFITMLIGWELLGVTSYLLIGFWYSKDKAPEAARKAITIVLIGDMAMFAAIVIIFNTVHSLAFSSVITYPQTPALYFAMLLILLAIMTKSAQFPFHEWLTDAMEGPTPVSAFLHSSTMVKAGVFLTAVLLPMFTVYDMLPVILVIGLVTAVIGAASALAENHVKKVLAYSTIEELGLMLVALGLGSLPAAMAIFVVQTFYKALLFMSAGAIMQSNGRREDINTLYGTTENGALLGATAIAVLAKVGIVPLSGLFGTGGLEVYFNEPLVYVTLLAVGFVTSVYMFRWLFIPMQPAPGRAESETRSRFRSISIAMLAPIYLLCLLIFAGGAWYVLFYSGLFGQGYQFGVGGVDSEAELIIAIVGVYAAAVLYGQVKRYDMKARSGTLYSIVYTNPIFNRMYLQFAAVFAGISDLFDRADYAAYRSLKSSVGALLPLSGRLASVEDGMTNTYAAGIVVGLIAILLMLLLK